MNRTDLRLKYKVCHLERVEYENEANRRFMHSISLVDTEHVEDVYYENFPRETLWEGKHKKTNIDKSRPRKNAESEPKVTEKVTEKVWTPREQSKNATKSENKL